MASTIPDLTCLSNEVLSLIVDHLGLRDILRLGLTCRHLRAVAKYEHANRSLHISLYEPELANSFGNKLKKISNQRRRRIKDIVIGTDIWNPERPMVQYERPWRLTTDYMARLWTLMPRELVKLLLETTNPTLRLYTHDVPRKNDGEAGFIYRLLRSLKGLPLVFEYYTRAADEQHIFKELNNLQFIESPNPVEEIRMVVNYNRLSIPSVSPDATSTNPHKYRLRVARGGYNWAACLAHTLTIKNLGRRANDPRIRFGLLNNLDKVTTMLRRLTLIDIPLDLARFLRIRSLYQKELVLVRCYAESGMRGLDRSTSSEFKYLFINQTAPPAPWRSNELTVRGKAPPLRRPQKLEVRGKAPVKYRQALICGLGSSLEQFVYRPNGVEEPQVMDDEDISAERVRIKQELCTRLPGTSLVKLEDDQAFADMWLQAAPDDNEISGSVGCQVSEEERGGETAGIADGDNADDGTITAEDEFMGISRGSRLN